MSRRLFGVVVPIPTFPLPCCRTNCEVPMVKPWPLAIVEVPDVCVAARSPKYPVPEAVRAVVDAYGNLDAREVEVAMKYSAAGVEVATTALLPFVARREFVIPARVRAPVEEKLEVAVAPKYALLYTERSVEEAPPVN